MYKILLERTGAKLRFTNASANLNPNKLPYKGAQVEMTWIRTKIEVSVESKEGLIKKNPRNIN